MAGITKPVTPTALPVALPRRCSVLGCAGRIEWHRATREDWGDLFGGLPSGWKGFCPNCSMVLLFADSPYSLDHMELTREQANG